MGALVSTNELANRLGISVRMLETLIAKGQVPPFIKIGRLRRWHPERVDAWINERFSLAGRELEVEEASNEKIES